MIIQKLFRRLLGAVKRDRGSSTIELAIVFPILLLFFVATAELGRLFYTYNTLAKATKVGARYLTTERGLTSNNPDTVAAAKLRAASLVVCGYESCNGNLADGSPKKPIVPGLDMANPTNSVLVTVFTQNETTAIVRYVTVEIQNYTYQRGVFTLAGPTGAADSAIYFSLAPKTTMRFALANN